MTVILNRPPNVKSNMISNLKGEGALAKEQLASQFYNSHSGIKNLSRYMTINSVTKDANFIYYGGDASASGFNPRVGGATGNLTLQAGTVPTYNQGSPYHGGPDDDSLKLNGGGYFKAGNITFGQVATEDLVIEAVIKGNTLANEQQAGTRTTGVGWRLYQTATGLLRVLINDGSGSLVVAATTVVSQLNHIIWFFDRSGSAVPYVNGVVGTPVNISGGQLTLTVANNFAIGSNPSGSSDSTSNIVYLGMWSGAAWLDSHLQPALVADRYQRVTRTMPDFASGTRAPTAATRAFSAYSEKLENGRTETAMYLMGNNQIRVNSKLSKSGEYFEGVHLEPQVQNLFIQSEDIATSWTLLDLGDTTDLNAIAAPNKALTVDGLIADATNGVHGVSQVVTMTAVSTAISRWFKKGSTDIVCIEDETIANGKAYFNLTTGAVGSKEAGVNAHYIRDYGNGLYRCISIVTGTPAAHTVSFKGCVADGTDTMTGDGVAVAFYMWGAQCECNGLGYATSYIPTVLATATRLADVMTYVGGANIGGENIGQGKFVMDVLFDEFDLQSDVFLGGVSDGGAAADSILVYANATGDVATCATAATAGNAGAATVAGSLTDGEIHRIEISYQTDRLVVSLDGNAGAADVSCDMPNALDTLHLGTNHADLLQPGCLIRNPRFYSDPDVEL